MANIFDSVNSQRFTDIWKKCSSTFKIFEDMAFNPVMKVIDSVANQDKYSLTVNGTLAQDDLDEIQVCSLMILLRYRGLLELLSKKNFRMVQDFFHEIESNREYHARQLLVLQTLSDTEMFKGQIKPYIHSLNIGNMEELNLILFEANNDSSLTVYEKPWLVNALMVHFASWEVRTFESRLFKQDYMLAVVTENQMPSHIRILSKVVGKKKEEVMKLYPESLLMNYSNFYPIDLYHSGRPPI